MVLLGHKGLVPAQMFVQTVRNTGGSGWAVLSLFWWRADDVALMTGLWAGLICCGLALLGVWPRAMFALCAILYGSFVNVGSPFFNFQWDNLLIESGVLAAFLPWDRAAPRRHLLFRLLLFKLYFESGLAKWQSPLGDWQDGTALQAYFETAPLPTFVGWYAHHLPAIFLRTASWATLGVELAVPCLFFCGRRARLVAAFILTGFQLLNVVTANYGFFAFLAVALHVFLLSEADVEGIERDVRASSGPIGRLFAARLGTARLWALPTPMSMFSRHLGHLWSTAWTPLHKGLRRCEAVGLTSFAALYIYVSGADALRHFGPDTGLGPPLAGLLEGTHAINTYRLFGAITTQRIEPEVQADDGTGFVPVLLWHKPGDISRAPNFVAPHQPRLDFQLWFQGLRRANTPLYLHNLITHLCHDPTGVWPLFRPTLPHPIHAVRLAYWQYRFTTPDERRASGNWWKRSLVEMQPPHMCRTR